MWQGIRLYRGDWVVILCALMLNAWLIWSFYGTGGREGDWLIIRSSAAAQQKLRLSDSGQFTVPGREGDSVIEVRNGMARFLHSPCTGRHCVRAGWLSHDGDWAACLPNLVSLYVDAGQNRFDSINY